MDATKLILQKLEELDAELADTKAQREKADEADKKALDERLAAIEENQGKFQKALEATKRLSIPGLEVGKRGEEGKLSWARVVQFCAMPEVRNRKEYGLEREVYDHMQKTAINAGSGTGGGFLVPTQMMLDIIPELRDRSYARQLGVTVIDGLSPGNITWSKSRGGITAEHLNTEQEVSGTETVATFDQITLTPRPIAAFVPLTRQMQTQTPIALEAWVRGEIATQIGLLEDQSVFVGTGANGAPRGVANHPSIGFESFSGVNTIQELWDMLVNVVLATRNQQALGLSGLGWAAAPAVLYHLARVLDANGRPLFSSLSDASGQTSGAPGSVVRYPILDPSAVSTGTAAAERLIFGPWGDVILGHWGTLELAMSDQTEENFRKARATVRGIMEYDVGVFHGSAFTHIGSDASTPNYDSTQVITPA